MTYKNCVLKDYMYYIGGYRIIPFSNEPPDESSIKYETIHGFKGLDSRVVTIIEIENINQASINPIMYLCTYRSKQILYIFIKGHVC